jgi:hypothetical protein
MAPVEVKIRPPAALLLVSSRDPPYLFSPRPEPRSLGADFLLLPPPPRLGASVFALALRAPPALLLGERFTFAASDFSSAACFEIAHRACSTPPTQPASRR